MRPNPQLAAALDSRKTKITLLIIGFVLVLIWHADRQSPVETMLLSFQTNQPMWPRYAAPAVAGLAAALLYCRRIGWIVPLFALIAVLYSDHLLYPLAQQGLYNVKLVLGSLNVAMQVLLFAELASLFTGRQRAFVLLSACALLSFAHLGLQFVDITHWPMLEFPAMKSTSLIGAGGFACLIAAFVRAPLASDEPIFGNPPLWFAHAQIVFLTAALGQLILLAVVLDRSVPNIQPWNRFIPPIAYCALVGLSRMRTSEWRIPLLVGVAGLCALATAFMKFGVLPGQWALCVQAVLSGVSFAVMPVSLCAGRAGFAAGVSAGLAYWLASVVSILPEAPQWFIPRLQYLTHTGDPSPYFIVLAAMSVLSLVYCLTLKPTAPRMQDATP